VPSGAKKLHVHPQQSDWLNVFEAAEYLNVTVRFVRRTLRYEVPFRQSGGRQPIYFHRHQLDLWAARQVQTPERAS
jgi:Helix-turn-helix domain